MQENLETGYTSNRVTFGTTPNSLNDPVLVSRGKFSGALEGWSEVLSEVSDPVVVEMIRKRTPSGKPAVMTSS